MLNPMLSVPSCEVSKGRNVVAPQQPVEQLGRAQHAQVLVLAHIGIDIAHVVLVIVCEDDAFHGLWKHAVALQIAKDMVQIHTGIDEDTTLERPQVGTVATGTAPETHKEIVARLASFTVDFGLRLRHGCGLGVVLFKFYVFASAMFMSVIVSIHC